MNHTLLVYLHSGKVVRLDFEKSSEAFDALSSFADEGEGTVIVDDRGEYAFRFENIAFVKKITEEE